nr:SHOCT domain-containing protein [Neobacillus terrae]
MVGMLGFLGIILIFWAFSGSPIFGSILLILLIGAGVYTDKKNKKEKEEKQIIESLKRLSALEKLREVTFFKIDKIFEGSSFYSDAVAVDEKNKKVAFIEGQRYRIYNNRDILSSEVLIDGKETMKTSRSSQLGGALIGGALAGGVGAIIGGLSGTQTKDTEVSKIDLRITVKDINNPSYSLNFFNFEHYSKGVIMPHPIDLLKNEIEQAQQLHTIISVLIKQAIDADNFEKPTQQKIEGESGISSIANEIRELGKLRDEGLISQEEFENKKTKLLLI